MDLYRSDFIVNLKMIIKERPISAFNINPDNEELHTHFRRIVEFLYVKHEKNLSLTKEELYELFDVNPFEKIEILVLGVLKGSYGYNLNYNYSQILSKLDITRSVAEKIINNNEMGCELITYVHKVNCPVCGVIIQCSLTHPCDSQEIKCSECHHLMCFHLLTKHKFRFYLNLSDEVYFDYCNCNACSEWNVKLLDYIDVNIGLLELFIRNETSCLFDDNKKIESSKLFHIHKNSLPKTIAEILSYEPENFEELTLILYEMESRSKSPKETSKIIELLVDKGVVSKSFNIDHYEKQIGDVLDAFMGIKIRLENGLKCSVQPLGVKRNNKHKALSIEFRGDKYFCVDLNCAEISIEHSYELNVECIKKEVVFKKSSFRIFSSNAEKLQFESLVRQYDSCYIVCNICMISYVGSSGFEVVEGYFSKDELSYLRYCIVDFVIMDTDGYVIKVIELNKGRHHDDKDWIYKDSLKKKCHELLGIDFSVEF
ncbi:hypothetical protein ACFFLZ_01470 [Photobacterium aphoticum]|uniref:hypothetical protein n=1 Tax=Photobacterium aphoticum TaxID=754436 RepID=UPI000B04CFC7|nr:hypothetical protein [Photobacterium aphoticum]GHA40983.1 hypothetical protein GCM10007086_13320 [Photobacterium aphoticum]